MNLPSMVQTRGNVGGQNALNRAGKAQTGWAHRPILDRRAIMLRFHDLILRHQKELLDLLEVESGMRRQQALVIALAIAVDCRRYAYQAELYLLPRRRGIGAGATVEVHEPAGTIVIPIPSPDSLQRTMLDTILALLAGNAVVLTAPEHAPSTALFFARLLYAAGLPDNVLQIVIEPSSETQRLS